MPALRKRKSRTSTPLATPADTPTSGSDQRKEKTQSSLDAWIEPAPQNPAPSFEEHGFARHGVLENMAPLGVPPSSRMKMKARTIGESNHRRALLGAKGNAYLGDEDGTTPEVTPGPELDRDRDDSERQDEDDPQHAFLDQDEDEDDDYMPTKKKPKLAHGVRTPVRGKGAAQGKLPAQGKTPMKNGIPKAAATPAFASPAADAVGLEEMDHATQQRIQIAVNDAIGRSNKQNRREVGVALKEMLEKSRDNPNLARSLDGVIHQKETQEDYTLFRRFIKTAKKAFKRKLKMQQAEDAARAARHARTTSSFVEQADGSSPAAESEIGPNDSASANLDLDTNAVRPSKAAARAEDDLESLVGDEPAAVAPHPLTTAPTFPATETSTPPAPRVGSKSPRKQQTTNGNLAPDSEQDANAEASTTVPTPAAKTPDSAAASDSGLSEVDEDILRQPPPPVSTQVNGNGNVAPPLSKKARAAAIARAGKKSRANSMKPFGKHKEKPPPTPQELAEQAEIRQIRQKYIDGQRSIRDTMATPAPTSDIRFDDEILETESLTESQIAVGPPVDATRPRRAGRAPRNGISIQTSAKRAPEGSRFSSPRLDSATTSRPSTPAALSHVPNKRVKLNNGQAHQAARTKKSPVKNRDGPIAGIPHTGGGGSRQLGPDDNDPDSPPSESDDLCSACKGAGEFVCCDNCPRVFHFLCCDPPRVDAPTGSFLCHDCTAKLKPADEGADSYTPLGPLFRSLDFINPRAFALPANIQNHFENVTARPDGSYAEETKKFPLAKSSGYGYQRPDYTKIMDGDHKPILCASCGLTAEGKRPMLKCDFCPSHWHLDCLDPPMANPPNINFDATHRDAWRCPRHIEHDLRSGYVLQTDLPETQDAAVVDAPIARLGRKVRKPRHPQVIQPTFSRGMRNNGLIEVINDPDDDTDGEGNYVFGGEEKDLSSHVYRVPERGVVLDFIEKVKSCHIAKKAKMDRASERAAEQRKLSMQNFAARPIQQQQAALNLAKLADKEHDIGLNERDVDALVIGLTAEAPNDVVTALAEAPPPPITAEERIQLLKFQELIKIRLGG